MKYVIKHMALLLALIAVTSIARAQIIFREYLVSVDPQTGAFTIIDSIPGAAFVQTGPSCTTTDQVHSRFIFYGIDFTGQYRLYTIDEITGHTIYAPPVRLPHQGDVFGPLSYDNSTHGLYGLYWDDQAQTEYFISVDQQTGAFAIINSILPVKYVVTNAWTYDQNHHIFYFIGITQAGVQYLYGIDALTGQTVSYPEIRRANAFVDIKYDNPTNTLYGNVKGYLVKIDPATADTTVLGNVANITGVAQVPNYATFDETRQRYTLCADGGNPSFQLYTLDTLQGNVIYDPTFPVGLRTGENLVELCYDNHNGVLYGLHWGYVIDTPPPPLDTFAMADAFTPNGDGRNDFFYPVLSDTSRASVVSFTIYNRWGQCVYSDAAKAWDGTYQGDPQPEGIYTYFVTVMLTGSRGPDHKKEVRKSGSFTLMR